MIRKFSSLNAAYGLAAIATAFVFAAASASAQSGPLQSGSLQSATAQLAVAPLASPTVDAAYFLGTDYMQSPFHRVAPAAASDGYMLRYFIDTRGGRISVLGTEQTKNRIREIHATEALRRRSTGGAILGSAKDRTTNLVKTPYRLGKGLVAQAGEIDSVADAAFFIPERVNDVAGGLIGGVGELAVTGARITKGAAGTKCSGLNCAAKAGSDIWSGINSLAGKHNASRRLHAEFGTDPQTDNKAYRKQIDRLAYANSYTGTAIKLGAGQAGIDYISPAFTGVGYINNAEFVGGYEDAHRQKNKEKKAYAVWGAHPQAIDDLFRNDAFTKLDRRRLFNALSTIPDKAFAVKLLHDVAGSLNRSHSKNHLATYDYIAGLTSRGDIAAYNWHGAMPMITSRDGTLILPVYADLLERSPQLSAALSDMTRQSAKSALHVLGYASPHVKSDAQRLGVQVVQWPGRGF